MLTNERKAGVSKALTGGQIIDRQLACATDLLAWGEQTTQTVRASHGVAAGGVRIDMEYGGIDEGTHYDK